MRTAATSPTRTGVPSRLETTTARTSSRLRMAPSARTTSDSSPSDRRPAPSLRLFASSACCSAPSVTPRAASAALSGTTSKLRTSPPRAFTSATPGRVRSAGRITQSSRPRRSSRVRSPPSMVNMNISPSGVVIGARPPSAPGGRSRRMPLRRSVTWLRAQ